MFGRSWTQLFWPSRSGAAGLVSLPVVEVLFCLALGQVESRLVLLLINPRSRWPMGPTWPLAEEPPIWAFNWKSLGSGNVGTVRTDFVPSMCSSKDLRVASALNCLLSQASQSSGPFRVMVADSLKSCIRN